MHSDRTGLSENISIHTPLAGSDVRGAESKRGHEIFQSTLSVRRATGHHVMRDAARIFQSTLSMRRATL